MISKTFGLSVAGYKALAISAGAFPLFVVAPALAQRSVPAARAATFLSSLGVNTHVDQGYDPKSYVAPLKYLGVRQVRDGERHVEDDVAIVRQTGVHFTLMGGGDLKGLMASAKVLAKAGALLAVEGPNEPNNFPITYDGQQGGGAGHSWYAVAHFQADLYAAFKSDPLLTPFAVFAPSETGAETDNVGLQFLTVPHGSDVSFPAGTRFSDYANVHNYVSGNGGKYSDNQAWNAASPTLNDRWDGLFGNSGLTWFRHYQGVPKSEIGALPRVTTETGWDTVSNPGGETTQGTVLTNTYLAQFKRGWRYTFIYELRDGEGGSGAQGLYHGDVAKQSAVYIHNLTTILDDEDSGPTPGALSYDISQEPATVHDLLLQKGKGPFDLVVWGEKVQGSESVTVTFPAAHKLIKVYDITRGTDPVRTLKDAKTVPLTMTDHAVILEITD